MTRGLILTNAIALAIGAAGLMLLARPAAARRLLGIADGDAAAYALRIIGAMILAVALFLAGFSTAYRLASAG